LWNGMRVENQIPDGINLRDCCRFQR
jgi:hypothetical protein